MAKKVKFPLDMGNDIMVRTIEELKENYNIEKVTEYFFNDKLVTWLEDRYYDDEAEQVRKLSSLSDKSNVDARLAEIFGILIDKEVDIEAIELRREKLEKLRAITSDDEILDNVDSVAFSQEELSDLLDDNAKVIFLCGKTFRIPLSVKNVKYVGINNPDISISGNGEIDLAANGIIIEQCKLSEDTQSRLVKKAEKGNDNDILYTSITDFELKGNEDVSDDDDEDHTVYLERYIGTDSLVKIPDIVTYISYSAFKNCKNIERLIIPNNVTYISDKAFCGCEKLARINIPDCLAKIEDMLFYGCKNLTHVDIPDSVTEIGEKAFCGCEKLESISIPDSVTQIKNMAFYGCKNLKKVNIPQSVTEIGENAFLKCDKSQIIFSNPDIEYHESAIQCGGSFDIEHTDNGLKIFKYDGTETVVDIPDNVTMIGKNAFEECTWIKKIHIPDSVTKIENAAFRNCINLESISLPGEIAEIESYTFCGCENLKSIDIPYGVTKIGDSAFSGCSRLINIDIPNSVTEIRDWAFQSCKNLESINLPSGIEEISGCLFMGCKHLKNIDIPYNVERIGWNAFDGCESLESILIPNKCEFISDRVFRDCTNLTSVNITGDVYKIEECIFENCINLVNVILPQGLYGIEQGAFKNCRSLNYINLPSNLSTDGLGNDVFEGCADIHITYGGKTYDYNHIGDLEEMVKSGEARRSSISYDDDDDDDYGSSGGLFGFLSDLFS